MHKKLKVLVLTTTLLGIGSAFSWNTWESWSQAALTPYPRAILQNYGGYKSETNQKESSEGGLQKLMGHVPWMVQLAQPVGKVESDKVLPISVFLRLNNEGELDQLLDKMTDPASPSFQHFLTSAEFKERFSPTSEQVDQVRQFLASHGIQVDSISENSLILRARGPVSSLEESFHTEIHYYTDAAGHTFFGPAYELMVPESLSIQGVFGLENVVKAHHHSVKRSEILPAGRESGVAIAFGTGPNGAFSPSDIKTAYGLNNSSATGAGQTLALFELDGYTPSDISYYQSYFKLPEVPLQNIYVDGVTGTPGGGAGEVTLDIELMAAIAPGAAKILVYEGPNSGQGLLDTYNRIAVDNTASVISSSWGLSELDVGSLAQAENTIFKQMVAQGQTLYAASGDSGAYDDGSTTLSVDDPSSQPYVVGVGGTHLVTQANGSYSSESAWNHNNTSSGGAGGGGISKIWTIPTWQVGVASSSSLGSSTMRNVPDVSLDADPYTGYSIYMGGQWEVYGGTSCAAPLWAGFTALVNQERRAVGGPILGFSNPVFYRLGAGSSYTSLFHDINNGTTNLYYPSVKGYDLATGWGSFDGASLIQELVQLGTPSPAPSSSPAPTPSSIPSPSPTPIPSPSPTHVPSPTPVPSASPISKCYPAWSATAVYVAGNLASYQGQNYQANWWTQGQNPLTNSGVSGSGQPWAPLGACAGQTIRRPH